VDYDSIGSRRDKIEGEDYDTREKHTERSICPVSFNMQHTNRYLLKVSFQASRTS
jgi:hypothetical protein